MLLRHFVLLRIAPSKLHAKCNADELCLHLLAIMVAPVERAIRVSKDSEQPGLD
jgi:hypothetical protein